MAEHFPVTVRNDRVKSAHDNLTDVASVLKPRMIAWLTLLQSIISVSFFTDVFGPGDHRLCFGLTSALDLFELETSASHVCDQHERCL